MRVWKSVGAVAIYSPSRAAGLAGGAMVAVVGAGFLGGLAVGKNSSDSVTHVVTQRVAAHAPKADPAATPVSKTAAYKRGYAAGSKQAATAAPSVSGLGSGGPYVVRASRSADGSIHVIQAVPVQGGKTYYMCAGGSRLCISSGG